MLRPRIIPCLLVKNGGLVKTVSFAQPKYVGDPINAVRIFNEKEVDELIVLDIDATCASARARLRADREARRRVPDAAVLRRRHQDASSRRSGSSALGVEKVAISSAARRGSGAGDAMAEEVGSQSVVVVLDVRRDNDGALRGLDAQRQRGTRRRLPVAVRRETDGDSSAPARSSSTPSTTTAR